MKLTGIGTAALLALAMLLPVVASADPAPPAFVLSDQTNQSGTYDPANGKFNSAWFSLSIYNGGTSTYTQMHLVVAPNDTSVVARAALDATKQTPTASSLCVMQGNGFVCNWTTNLGGGASTSPITFVFGAPSGNSYDVAATFTSKDHTTTSGGGSGQDRDISASKTISVNVDARLDQQTPYLLPNLTPITVSTWKKNGVAALTLPASTTGYLVDLSESELGLNFVATGCDLNASNSNVFAWAQYAKASVNHGATIAPYLEWKTSAIWDNRDGSLGAAPAPPTGVIHCVDNGDGTFTSHVLTLAANPCPATVSNFATWGGCVVKISTQVQGKKGSIYVVTTYTVIFRTPTNGYSKPQ
jgi:hypothetical protein